MLTHDEHRARNRDCIRAAIEFAGVTQREAAALVHVPLQTLKGWVKQAGPNVAPDMAVELLCLKVGYPVPEFLLLDQP